MPDGPPAAPRRALRRFRAILSGSRAGGLAGTTSAMSAGIGSRRIGGRFCGFCNSSSVAVLQEPLMRLRVLFGLTIRPDAPTPQPELPWSPNHHTQRVVGDERIPALRGKNSPAHLPTTMPHLPARTLRFCVANGPSGFAFPWLVCGVTVAAMPRRASNRGTCARWHDECVPRRSQPVQLS